MEFHELKHFETTKSIIGCAMKVHRYFGPGFPEVVYKRALLIELKKAGLRCSEEVQAPIHYEGQLIYKRRLDIIAENIVLLELKAQKTLEKGDFAQIVNYLRVFKKEVGLLLNFGASSLQFKRFVYTVTNP